jgi:hypothetical protein
MAPDFTPWAVVAAIQTAVNVPPMALLAFEHPATSL